MNLVGRKGLAQILDVTENATRSIQARGEIAPEGEIDGRPVFSIPKAQALRAKREAERIERLRHKLERRPGAAA
jgi:hypothetical protein